MSLFLTEVINIRLPNSRYSSLPSSPPLLHLLVPKSPSFCWGLGSGPFGRILIYYGAGRLKNVRNLRISVCNRPLISDFKKTNIRYV